MKTATQTLRVALAMLVFVLLSSADLAAKGKPPGGGGGGFNPPPNPEIAFTRAPRNQAESLFLANADGTSATIVHSVPNRGISVPDFSPSANELVFNQVDFDARISRLMLLRYSYSAAGIVAGAPIELDVFNDTNSVSSDISPDGKYVLYRAFNEGVFLRSTDPDTDDARLIYDEREVIWNGAVWLVASTGYKIALNTIDPDNSNEREIIIATVDPTQSVGMDVIQSIAGVLATASQPFTILASLESARTSESLVVHALFKDEYYRTKPNLMPASRPVLWDVATDQAVALVAVAGEERNFRYPVFSPDDSQVIVNSLGILMKIDLATQASTSLGEGTVCDWKPPAP